MQPVINAVSPQDAVLHSTATKEHLKPVMKKVVIFACTSKQINILFSCCKSQVGTMIWLRLKETKG